jgi:secreted Zn-dependent insulinase-like peptidase
LDNGLKVVVVSDMESNNAGVSLVVGAGSFDNPKEFPGLAHFTEHMLFLGTKKYPIPDEFQKFIQAHSGSYNATTEDEQTSFYFTIDPESFSKALDRFSDFFIAPLFTQELVEREINAVDSEFHMNIQQDSWAALEVFKETSNPEHPFSQFSVGNLQTLGKEKTKLYDALIAFHHKHYRATK